MIVAYQSKIKTAANLLDADNCKLDSCNYHCSSYSNHITIHQSIRVFFLFFFKSIYL